jgi:hypothetical protein
MTTPPATAPPNTDQNPFLKKAEEEARKPKKASLLDGITTGKKTRPIFCFIYGPEGVGKSTFAAGAPNPIFLQTERGSDQLSVARFPIPKTFLEFKRQIQALDEEPNDYQTIVIDSMDGLEFLLWQQICEESNPKVESIEQISYGGGYSKAKTLWRKLLGKLTEMSATYNVILIGHAVVKPFVDPSLTAAYDQWRPRLHDKSSEVIKESVDLIAFATVDVQVFKPQGERKGRATTDGERVLHAQPTSVGWVCKNRFNLEDPLPLKWADLAAGVKAFYEEN